MHAGTALQISICQIESSENYQFVDLFETYPEFFFLPKYLLMDVGRKILIHHA